MQIFLFFRTSSTTFRLVDTVNTLIEHTYEVDFIHFFDLYKQTGKNDCKIWIVWIPYFLMIENTWFACKKHCRNLTCFLHRSFMPIIVWLLRKFGNAKINRTGQSVSSKMADVKISLHLLVQEVLDSLAMLVERDNQVCLI